MLQVLLFAFSFEAKGVNLELESWESSLDFLQYFFNDPELFLNRQSSSIIVKLTKLMLEFDDCDKLIDHILASSIHDFSVKSFIVE